MLTTPLNTMANRVFAFRPAAGPLSSNSGVNGEERRVWSPPIDLFETPEAYHVHVDLPGTSPEQVNLTFERGTLTIHGTREPAWRAEERAAWRLYAAERFQGEFSRSMRLPEQVDADRISATFADGVLTVLLPKAEAAMARRIPINAAQVRTP